MGEGKGGMFQENSIETCILSRVKQITSPGWMHETSAHDSVGEGKGGMFQENSIETCIVSRMKQITSPGWMHETSARTWCTGKT